MSANLSQRTEALNPLKNPSYPSRVHIREKPALIALESEWREKVARAAAERSTKASPDAGRILVQMAGSLDQIANSVSRMPTECGDLYEEDKHRLEQAAAALERLISQWNSLT
jgi:hypothetical protein